MGEPTVQCPCCSEEYTPDELRSALSERDHFKSRSYRLEVMLAPNAPKSAKDRVRAALVLENDALRARVSELERERDEARAGLEAANMALVTSAAHTVAARADAARLREALRDVLDELDDFNGYLKPALQPGGHSYDAARAALEGKP